MPSDSQTRAEQQRRRRAAQAIAKGRRPGVIGRPPASPAEKAAGAVIQKIVEHLDDLFKPSEVADVESFLAKIMGEYEPSDNSDEYRECIYRSLEGDEPIDGEEPELSFADGVEPMTAPAAAPRTQSRIGRRQQQGVAAVGLRVGPSGEHRLIGTVFVVGKTERAVYFAGCAHVLLDMLRRGVRPFEHGVDVGLGGDPIRWLNSHARVRFVSLPPADYFSATRTTRESTLERIQSLGQTNLVVDDQHSDLCILELPLNGENGEVLVVQDDVRHLRPLPFADQAPLGRKVFVLGYGQSGDTLSAPHITTGTVASVPANGFLRIDGTILSGHSGGPVVTFFKDEWGRND